MTDPSGKQKASRHSLRAKSAVAGIVCVLLILTATSESKADEVQAPVEHLARDLVSPYVDWQVQGYKDSRGVVDVRHDLHRHCLIADCDLIGKHEQKSKGEILIDLKQVVGVAPHVPIDMTHRRIIAEIIVPRSFVTADVYRNGVAVFALDDGYRGQWGTWENCGVPGRFVVQLQPSSTMTPWRGATKDGFDAKHIRFLGVKFGMNKNSRATFRGEVMVTSVRIVPEPLPFTTPPEFPKGTPQAHILGDSVVKLKADGFYVAGIRTFICGGNWRPPSGYGQAFGRTKWFPNGVGTSRFRKYVDARLKALRLAGITWLRVGLLDDGRAMLDENSDVVGYDDVFHEDVQAILDLSAQNKIKVEFVLLDFLAGGKGEDCNGVWVRGHRSVFEDQEIRQRFIHKFLGRFLKDFGRHDAFVAVDCLNECEWLISREEGGGWEYVDKSALKAERPIARDTIEKYVNECAEIIRRESPDKLITLGVSATHVGLVRHVNVDYYGIHWYPNMGALNESLDRIPKDKPFLLEEFPASGSISNSLRTVKEAGGLGAHVWSFNPGDDKETYRWDQETGKLQEIRLFVDQLSAE